MQLPPLSLYVHFPWCERKCPYCDFNSHELSGALEEDEYIDQLLADLSTQKPYVMGRKVQSIFFGGGTPSLFSPEAITRLLEGIAQRVTLERGVEITLEANPGSVEAEKFKAYLAAGVNRLSLGIQSFQDDKLLALGRIHNAQEAQNAFATARASGCKNINLDLMHGLPGQSLDDAMFDLERALALEPEHISWYQLTIEPKTVFARRPPLLPLDRILGDIEQNGLKLLNSSGYLRYEISAYAKPGLECKHNLNYWTFGDYLGIGAGAHGKLSLPDKNTILRSSRPRQPRLYLKPTALEELDLKTVSEPERIGEFLMNVLRLTKGVQRNSFKNSTGLDLKAIESGIEHFENLEIWQKGKIGLSKNGLRYLDSVVEYFL